MILKNVFNLILFILIKTNVALLKYNDETVHYQNICYFILMVSFISKVGLISF